MVGMNVSFKHHGTNRNGHEPLERPLLLVKDHEEDPNEKDPSPLSSPGIVRVCVRFGEGGMVRVCVRFGEGGMTEFLRA